MKMFNDNNCSVFWKTEKVGNPYKIRKEGNYEMKAMCGGGYWSTMHEIMKSFMTF